MSTPTAVQCRQLTKQFRRLGRGSLLAVNALDLDIPSGTCFALLGPNGAGKTTTIHMLLGLIASSDGQSSILGGSIKDPAIRRRIGFVPQRFRMPDYLRASEFLDIHGQLLGLSRSERKTRAAAVLELVELSDRARDRVGSFSGGMEQRLVVAQAMLGNPDLLILDEPTSALDPLGRRDVLAFIKRVHDQGTTVVLNSHILSEVESVCDSVAIIQRGSLVHQGRIADLSSSAVRVNASLVGDGQVITESLTPYVHADTLVIGEPVGPDQVRMVQWQSDIPRQVADAGRSLHDAGIEIWRLAPAHESLEELFVRLVEAPPTGGPT